MQYNRVCAITNKKTHGIQVVKAGKEKEGTWGFRFGYMMQWCPDERPSEKKKQLTCRIHRHYLSDKYKMWMCFVILETSKGCTNVLTCTCINQDIKRLRRGYQAPAKHDYVHGVTRMYLDQRIGCCTAKLEGPGAARHRQTNLPRTKTSTYILTWRHNRRVHTEGDIG
jgi:hypothetical protein